MALEQFVILRADRLPTTAAWQAELDRLDTGIRLDETVEPASHDGFWPVAIAGGTNGFEFYLDPVDEAFEEPPADLGDRDLLACFRTGPNMTGFRCALMAIAALASLTDGVVLNDDLSRCTVTALLGEARSLPDD